MEKYTIYCTEEQTRKALELGAPIIELPFSIIMSQDTCDKYGMLYLNDKYYQIPTAEQMIGWLEEQEAIREIDVNLGVSDIWYYNIWDVNNYDIGGDNLFDSRKEATLAAIDAALDYLIKNKK